jgi:SAM-dependent methyltransferase
MSQALMDEIYTEPAAERQAEDDAWWHALRHEEVLDLFETYGTKGSVLDVGAGRGLFLDMAQNRGWSVAGTEVSAPAREYTMRHYGIQLSEEMPGEVFDAVHCRCVLEHVAEPEDFLAAVRRSLRPAGLLYICVPNDCSALQKSVPDWQSSLWWHSPMHHNYYNFSLLEGLLRQHGFSAPLYRTTSFPMELFLLMGMDFRGDKEVGRACHLMRCALDKKMPSETRRAFYRSLAEGGFGRTAEVLVRRMA